MYTAEENREYVRSLIISKQPEIAFMSVLITAEFSCCRPVEHRLHNIDLNEDCPHCTIHRPIQGWRYALQIPRFGAEEVVL